MPHMRNSWPSVLVLLAMFLFAGRTARAQEDLNVIAGKGNPWLSFTDAPNSLYHYLSDQAISLLDRRASEITELNSLADWQKRQSHIRETLMRIVGPFPQKTPLKAKVVRTVDKGWYRMEHIVYESQPSFYVTSSLFIPSALKKREKAPAVIYCSGHAEQGYRSDVYLHVILNLVKKGFIVFAFDPVGQGERLEYFDPAKGKSSVGGPTSEHAHPGSQAFITGSSQAKYMIWDGIRAVDYLLTRKEVDPARIGITGRSGGGTQSAYIAAFDDRIKAAAPECYITSFKRLLQSIGPQDAEQNFPGGISNDIDHADLLLVRAPKPALMITTTRDMFSIQGARETAREVSRIYHAYGHDDDFGMVEDDAPHASTEKNRESMYAFFQKQLNRPGDSTDEDIALPAKDDVRVTASGQVSVSLGGETVFSLNRREAERLSAALDSARTNETKHLTNAVAQARKLSGYREPDTAEPVFAGRIPRDGYAIEKYFIKGEGEYMVPFLLCVPAQPNHKAVLYLHPAGKESAVTADDNVAWFARNGFMVLAPDLPGVGELGHGAFKGDSYLRGISHNIWYESLLIGRSITAIQAADVAKLVSMLQKTFRAEGVYAVARKEMAPVLLHAAAFVPEIKRIALIEPLSSYRSLVTSRSYYSPFIPAAVAGMLRAYDLPDLAASLAPRPLMMIGAINGNGETDGVEEDMSFIRDTYKKQGVGDQLVIAPPAEAEGLNPFFERWTKD